MQYKPLETKWQMTRRLLKQWHPFWLPPAIIFLDRLCIMWPYIPIGEATFYMKAQAIETFDWSIFWSIHVAVTLGLLFVWTWLVCVHIGLCAYWVMVLNRLWKEEKFHRELEESVAIRIHCAVAVEQVNKYLRRIYKESKQDQFLLDNWPYGQFAVQALPRREFQEGAKSLPSHKIPNNLAATPADFADYMSAFKYVLRRVRATFETEVLLARPQGKAVEVHPVREGGGNSGQIVSGTRGEGKSSAGSSGPETLEPKPEGAESVGGSIQEAAADMAPPLKESRVEKEPSDETAAPSSTAPPPAPAAPIKWISLKEAEGELSKTIARRNQQRPEIGLPPLAATDIAKIRQEIFSRVDPAELEASREGQSPAPDAAPGADGGEQGSSVDMPETREPQPTRCEESCLVRQVRDGQDDEELNDDPDYQEEELTPECWEEKLGLAGGDLVVAAILLVMSNRNEWRGSPSELLAMLNLHTPDDVKNNNDWPKSAAWLTKNIKKVADALNKAGIDIEQGWRHEGRWVAITRR